METVTEPVRSLSSETWVRFNEAQDRSSSNIDTIIVSAPSPIFLMSTVKFAVVPGSFETEVTSAFTSTPLANVTSTLKVSS